MSSFRIGDRVEFDYSSEAKKCRGTVIEMSSANSVCVSFDERKWSMHGPNGRCWYVCPDALVHVGRIEKGTVIRVVSPDVEHLSKLIMGTVVRVKASPSTVVISGNGITREFWLGYVVPLRENLNLDELEELKPCKVPPIFSMKKGFQYE